MPEDNFGVGIIGMGKYVPKNIITNEYVAGRVGVKPEWIVERTGIQNRYFVSEGETASGISAIAARQAIERAKVNVDDISLIIGCTFSGDYILPAMACKVQELIGARNSGAFDVLANCTGFQVGVSIAADKLRCDPALKNILVIGTAVQSPYINWKDAETSMFFGDGAGAAILSRVPGGYGVLSTEVFCNSQVFEAVRLRGGGSSYPLRPENISDGLQYYEMDGMETWKQLIKYQPIVIKRALEKAGLKIEDTSLLIVHQANLRLIEYFMAKMKLPLSKTYTNVERIGNTADASLPIALCEANEKGLLKRGDIVVISGVGAGFIFGATVLRWY